MNPSAAEIARVMRDTGMDYMQARNHLICRYRVQQLLRRGSRP